MNKIKEVEARLKKNEAMICSMTKKERARPELLITDPTARSRLQRITKGSGMAFEDGQQFMSEFQRMKTMMSRMQKQMGGMAGGEEGMEPALAGGVPGQEMPPMGNRAARRMAKKKQKKGRGGGGGFG